MRRGLDEARESLRRKQTGEVCTCEEEGDSSWDVCHGCQMRWKREIAEKRKAEEKKGKVTRGG